MVEWKSTVKFLFLDYYTTTYWNLQSGAGVQNQCEALYIINSERNCISSKRSFVYHQADRIHTSCDDIRLRR